MQIQIVQGMKLEHENFANIESQGGVAMVGGKVK